MGWKWNDIAPQVDELVRAKKQELADTLAAFADAETVAVANARDEPQAKYHAGRASAFREVRDAVKP